MKEPKDKRTKAYKEWKKSFDAEQENKSKGLGDDIEKITEATGIKKLVKFIAGEDCGCDERQIALNKAFRYKRPKCLLENEYVYLKEWFALNRTRVNPSEQKQLLKIYNRVFNDKKVMTSCGSCIRTITNELNSLYKTYGN